MHLLPKFLRHCGHADIQAGLQQVACFVDVYYSTVRNAYDKVLLFTDNLTQKTSTAMSSSIHLSPYLNLTSFHSLS